VLVRAQPQNKKSAAEKIYLSRLQALAARRKTLVSYFARHSGEQKYCVSPFALSGSANSSAMCIPQTGSLTKRLLPAAGFRHELSPAAGRAFGCLNPALKSRPTSLKTQETINTQKTNLRSLPKKSITFEALACAPSSIAQDLNGYLYETRRAECMQAEKHPSNEIVWFQ